MGDVNKLTDVRANKEIRFKLNSLDNLVKCLWAALCADDKSHLIIIFVITSQTY